MALSRLLACDGTGNKSVCEPIRTEVSSVLCEGVCRVGQMVFYTRVIVAVHIAPAGGLYWNSP